MADFETRPFPNERQLVVDAGYLAARRHVIYGLIEANVTRVLELRRRLSTRDGIDLSFTAFLVATLARAIAATPGVQAYRDWRGRLVIFQDVDVVTMIEPRPHAVAIPHIIRQANRKTVRAISDEIRAVQAQPASSKQRGGLIALAPNLPRFVRLFFFWAVKKMPHRFKALQGTVIVTSVGMFGQRGGWGLGFLPTHTLGLTVGGIAQKPGVRDGQIVVEDILNMTVAFDHDIVDGAPAARFTKQFIDLIETAAVLEEVLD
jgi:pyruvate/2-oxoglutarate dehydrogenase complex dihydrolipoamide acyltransferase (E2) component